eukprot:SM000031S11628  [mRNA]  locus=s31:740999:741664:- [translate_table: standard]
MSLLQACRRRPPAACVLARDSLEDLEALAAVRALRERRGPTKRGTVSVTAVASSSEQGPPPRRWPRRWLGRRGAAAHRVGDDAALREPGEAQEAEHRQHHRDKLHPSPACRRHSRSGGGDRGGGGGGGVGAAAVLVDGLKSCCAAGLACALALRSFDPAAAPVSQLESGRFPCEDVGAYYAPADGLAGAALKDALLRIVGGHTVVPYPQVLQSRPAQGCKR